MLIELANVSGSEPLATSLLKECLHVGTVRVEVTFGNGVTSDNDLPSRIRLVRNSVVPLLPVDEPDLKSGHGFANRAGGEVAEIHDCASATSLG